VVPSPNPGPTEEYDGTSWTSGGSLNSKKTLAGCGTQTAALAFGGSTGSITGATEEYNGSTWATSNALNTARQQLSAGTQTAGLAFGGYDTATTGSTEEYDGTSWTSNPNLWEHARNSGAGAGTQTSALAFGGRLATRTYRSNRRMDRCRSTNNKNNNGKLIWQNI
jgi:hypothetical protein